MTDQGAPVRHPFEPRPAPAPEAREASAVEKFLGGSPLNVFARLFFVSLVVGALLIWLDIRPIEFLHALERFVNRLWALGFDAITELFQYVLAGAAVVVPVWLILRLMNMRPSR